MVKQCRATYKEICSDVTDSASEENFNFVEERDRLYEDSDVLHNLQPEDPQINQHHQGDDNYQPLQPVVNDFASSDSASNSPPPQATYGTFADRPARHVPHTT